MHARHVLTAVALSSLIAVGTGAGCGAQQPSARASTSRWSGLDRCAKKALDAYRCGTLTVPLDRTKGAPHDPGTLHLSVLVAGKATADRTLLVLTGGPGQPGPALAPDVLPMLAGVADHFRLVMLDQRGTGDGALRCPKLQAQLGFSDLEVPTDAAVRECGQRLGSARAEYSTTATVADLEDLRRALGVRKWSIDGVSYGTYTGQRYAAAHPDRVDKLVLDSVVPVTGFDPRMVEVFPEVARVLRQDCADDGCGGADPAADLHTVVARSPALGTKLLDVISVMSVVKPSFQPLIDRLHEAATGDDGPLRALLNGWQQGTAGPADQYSQGLHASTLSLDNHYPWGGAQRPLGVRAAAADRSVASLTPKQLWPFNARTARGNGEMKTCELWPRTADRPVPHSDLSLKGVDTLLVAGDRDLSTPLVWARRAHAQIPGSTLVVIPDAGHSTQPRHQRARDAVTDFLLG